MLGCVLAAGLQFTAVTTEPVAADSQDQPEDTPEILVTGERVARTLDETPSSVVVLTQATVDRSGADRLDQLLALVPNIQSGSGEEGPAIRGQDSTGVLRNLFAFLGGTRPRTTVQIDGRAIGYFEYVNSTVPVWDLERVEVFRSPQTTTQGRNAIAGAIFIQTNDPAYDWQASVRALAADSATRQWSGWVSGPIVADQIAIRASGDLRIGKTASALADAIPDVDIRRDDYALARFKVLVQPAAVPGLRIENTFVHTESQSPQFEAVQRPFTERRTTGFVRTNGVHKVNVDSFTSRIQHDAGGAVASSLTVSYGDALIRRFSVPGLGITRAQTKDRSIEAIANWRAASSANLLVGVNYLEAELDQAIDISGLGVGSGSFIDRQHSLGIFAEADIALNEKLRATLGARYQRDGQDRDGLVGTLPAGIFIDYDETFRNWLPKASIAYDLAPDTTVGILVQKAYNPGGTSISFRTRRQDVFDAESLWNYEAFLRASAFAGRVKLAVNAFFSDIRNAQRQQLVRVTTSDGATLDTIEYANAPKARTYGAEAEVLFRPARELSIRAASGLLRTKLTRSVLGTDNTRGKEFQRAPHFSASAGVDWTPIETLRLSGVVRHHTGYFSDDANDPRLSIPDLTVVDARAEYAIGGLTLFAQAHNLFDTFYLTYLFDQQLASAGDPREITVGLQIDF